jgi:hypothetical protein
MLGCIVSCGSCPAINLIYGDWNKECEFFSATLAGFLMYKPVFLTRIKKS